MHYNKLNGFCNYEASQGFFRTLLELLVSSAEWFEAIHEGINRKTG